MNFICNEKDCTLGFTMADFSKASAAELKKVIDGIRVVGKSGKAIKINTYKVKKESLLQIINAYQDACYQWC